MWLVIKYNPSALFSVTAKEISVMSGVSEGNSYSTLKDFRTYLKKALLAGRIVNIAGLSKF